MCFRTLGITVKCKSSLGKRFSEKKNNELEKFQEHLEKLRKHLKTFQAHKKNTNNSENAQKKLHDCFLKKIRRMLGKIPTQKKQF